MTNARLQTASCQLRAAAAILNVCSLVLAWLRHGEVADGAVHQLTFAITFTACGLQKPQPSPLPPK